MTGRFPVYCTEMCGTGHSTMRAEVVVMEPQQFDKWFAEERAMTHESTITLERRTPKIARVTFANPPANLIALGEARASVPPARSASCPSRRTSWS